MRTRALLSALAFLGCGVELVLPLPPQAVELPAIQDFAPKAAYGEAWLQVTGTGFDPIAENNEVRFAGGLAARGVDFVEGRLRVEVPRAVQETGPILLATLVATSPPSEAEFHPLGYGHPIHGTGVADLRFRHRPVGLVDRETTVVVASTLFDQLVTDYGRFTRAGGQPLAYGRSSVEGLSLLSVRSDTGGVLATVDSDSARIVATSDPDPFEERLIVPGAGPDAPLAWTVGVDPYGGISLATWTVPGERPRAARRPLDLMGVLGAATSSSGVLILVATVVSDDGVDTGLVRVTPSGTETLWMPEVDGDTPTGAIAVVDVGDRTLAAFAQSDGDLGLVDLATGAFEDVVAISYNRAGDVVASAVPGRVIVSKPLDGAIFQYDLATGDVEWSMQLRGEPTVLDVALELDEVAVANAEDNAVDIVQTSTGTWLGRVAFGLGLGSVDGGEGGAVAPYSYDPSEPERPQRIHLLARRAGLVITLDPSSLDVLDTPSLDLDATEALRLARTPDLRTLVVHRRELGLLEEDGERLVLRDLKGVPTAIDFAPDGRVVLGFGTSVELYGWVDEELERVGGATLPAGASLSGLRVYGDELLVAWRLPQGYG
ncbi:MAG: YncE family protein, partial [Thermoleophilia bacterium]